MRGRLVLSVFLLLGSVPQAGAARARGVTVRVPIKRGELLDRLTRIRGATDRSIERVRGHLGELHTQIETLQADAAHNAATAAMLRQELQGHHDTVRGVSNKHLSIAVAAAVVHLPLVLGLAVIRGLRVETQRAKLDAQLIEADARARRLDQALARHRESRTVLENTLSTLGETERATREQLSRYEKVAKRRPSVAALRESLTLALDLRDNLIKQASALRAGRDGAGVLAAQVDAHVVTLEAESRHAEEVAREARAALRELAIGVLAGKSELMLRQMTREAVARSVARELRRVGLYDRDDVEDVVGRGVEVGLRGGTEARMGLASLVLAELRR